jgi:hypothetical protein
MIKKILLVIFSTLFSLLIVEVVARIFVHPNYSKMEYQYQIDELLIYRHKPNFKGEWKTDEFIEVTELNSKGYRNPENTPNKQKVVFLGDSMVFGHGVNFEQTFAQLVAKEFSGHELINAAVKGYGTDQSFILFQEIIKEEKVSKIYLGIHLNDLYDNFVKRRFNFDGKKLISIPNEETVYPKLFIEYYKDVHSRCPSRALQYLFSKRLEKKVREESAVLFNKREQQLKLTHLLKEMLQLAQSKGAEIKFILMPIYDNPKENYEWLTSEVGKDSFILPEGFSKEDFLNDRIHLNVKGHLKMKSLILKNLPSHAKPGRP